MKKQIQHHFLLGLLIFTALFSLIPTSVFAAGERAYLTPSSGSSKPGNSFVISADGYVGDGGYGGNNGVSGSINFPANLLQVTNISAADSSFSSLTITPNNTTGKITFNQDSNWWFGINNQTVHLFTITFKSLANGTANVNFGTVQYYTGFLGTPVTAATSGGTYTISTPAPPTPSPSPTPSPTPTPSPSSTPKPTPKPSVKPKPSVTPTPSVAPIPEVTPAPVVESDGGLKIENVKVVTTRQEDTITWSLNNATATPTMTYGTLKNSQKSDGEVIKNSDGSYSVKLSDLKLGTLYYFTIKAASDNNLLGATYSGVFTTRGYPVQLIVKQNNLSISGAKVKIGERSFVTNGNATISTELGEGTFTAVITPPDSTESYNARFTVKKISIPSSGNPNIQSFTLNITTVGTSSSVNNNLIPLILAGTAVAVALIGGGLSLFLFKKRKKNTEVSSQVDNNNLLNSSYGAEIVQRRENTPTPNLDTAPIAPLPAMNMEEHSPLPALGEALPPMNMPAEQNNYAPVQNNPTTPVEPPSVAPTAADVSVPPADLTASLPLPPLENPAAVQQQYTDNVAPLPQENPEPEEYSEAITQVESSEQSTDSNEPSAVYDESTGELEIIHHHASHPSAAQSAVPIVSAETEPIPQYVTPSPQEQPPIVEAVATPTAPSTTLMQPAEAPSESTPPVIQTPLMTGPR